MAQKSSFIVHSAIALLIGLILLVIGVRPAFAHARVEIGPYVVIVGWKNEPVVVGERNALTIDVTKDDEPVEGLEGTLDANVLYAGQTFTGNLGPTETPGIYAVEILPTVRGLYSLQLSGAIEDLQVDEIVEPEEVLPATVLQFPESPPDARDLQSSIDDLSSQLQAARILGIAGVALAIVGIGVAAAAFLRKSA
jgi:hypothetical protein